MSTWPFAKSSPSYHDETCPICGGVIMCFHGGAGLSADRCHIKPCKKEQEEARIRELTILKLEKETK